MLASILPDIIRHKEVMVFHTCLQGGLLDLLFLSDLESRAVAAPPRRSSLVWNCFCGPEAVLASAYAASILQQRKRCTVKTILREFPWVCQAHALSSHWPVRSLTRETLSECSLCIPTRVKLQLPLSLRPQSLSLLFSFFLFLPPLSFLLLLCFETKS